jgi:ribosomal protein S18 acetylase RimI-like enzyme
MAKEAPHIQPVPLSRYYIGNAIKAAEAVFPDEIGTDAEPYKMFTASLDPDSYRVMWLDPVKVQELNYWLLTKDDDVQAFSGLYHRVGEHPDKLWLGWFGVIPNLRGQGYGKALLRWTISRAKVQGGRSLSLYTSDVDNEIAAQSLYDKFGFETYKTEPKDGYTLIYKRLKL